MQPKIAKINMWIPNCNSPFQKTVDVREQWLMQAGDSALGIIGRNLGP